MSSNSANKVTYRTAGSPRFGVGLVCVLVCMGIVIAMLGSLTRAVLMTQRSMRMEHRARQVECLAQSGLERAAWQLTVDENYQGETWTVPLTLRTQTIRGKVVIAMVETAEDDERSGRERQVRITVELPEDEPTAIRRTRLFTVFARNGLRTSHHSQGVSPRLDAPTTFDTFTHIPKAGDIKP